jgi:structural maintenance of chromosome 3 (chondroitin sulfate proteoglycan 6)
MSAYVEVCFDNSQDRFHTGKPEFYLRRTIGQKKDEYSIDRKNATKAEVQQILESAGFSRSNPYYIVPQGRVTALTNMKDLERLNLLKEISGSNVYETRRTDSLKLIADTDNKRSKIDELVQEIEKRLQELETEVKDLEDYNNKDREKRCLLWAINHRDELKCEERIAEIDSLRQHGISVRDNNRDLFIQNENDMKQIDIEINELKGQIELLRDEREQLEAERRESARAKAGIELELKELTDGQSAAQKARRRHEADLKNVQQQIKVREDELKQLLPQYTAKKEQEIGIRAQLDEARGQQKRLEDKQGRTAFYGNKRQRDDALRSEINDTSVDLATRKAVLVDTTEEIANLEKDIQRLEGEIEELRATLDNQGDNTLTHATQVQNARDKRERLQDQQKELWREEARLINQLQNGESQLHSAERAWSSLMDHSTSRGLETLRRLKAQGKLPGVYGTIAELIKVNNNYKTATEVTAGGSLFHVVCDNDTTATQLVDLLNKERGGRLTCIPLNRVRVRPVELPKATDAQPLISKLQYDSRYENAIQHIFGKTIICPDLTIASGYARSHGLNALTPDGDKANKKGVLYGGYADPSKSRLDAVQHVLQLREEVEKHRARRNQIKSELEKLEQQVTAALSELRKIQLQKDQVENSYGPMRQQLRALQMDLQSKKSTLERKRATATTLEAAINDLGGRQSDLEAELNSDFKKALSRDEEQMLVTLSSTLQDLNTQYIKLRSDRSELEMRKTEMENELRDNLQPLLDQMLSQENGTGGTANQSTRHKECERALKKINSTIASYDQKIGAAESEIEQLNGQLGQLEYSKAEKEQNNRELARAIERYQKRMDKSMQDRAQAVEDLARVQKEIRELGTLPAEHSKYERMSSEKVHLPLIILLYLLANINIGIRASAQSQRLARQILTCK